MESMIGKVLGIALRCPDKREMHEVSEARCVAQAGIEGDPASRPDRGMTLISAQQWRQATAELGVDLPWWTRRANVLIDTGPLGPFIGRTIRLGEIELEVCDETRPCDLMDKLSPGLRAALKPEQRGGVHGRIVRGGVLRIGDEVRLIGE
ncbi:MAG: molybdenum cofactor biosysynthesis protein [Planctomycetota bacterium]|nr:MAG: molybdenum cofactor biosysynthesis protein [Planctomycetota bacterium]